MVLNFFSKKKEILLAVNNFLKGTNGNPRDYWRFDGKEIVDA
jgi:hypothetical protein